MTHTLRKTLKNITHMNDIVKRIIVNLPSVKEDFGGKLDLLTSRAQIESASERARARARSIQ